MLLFSGLLALFEVLEAIGVDVELLEADADRAAAPMRGILKPLLLRLLLLLTFPFCRVTGLAGSGGGGGGSGRFPDRLEL